jgi:hypothetical protein
MQLKRQTEETVEIKSTDWRLPSVIRTVLDRSLYPPDTASYERKDAVKVIHHVDSVLRDEHVDDTLHITVAIIVYLLTLGSSTPRQVKFNLALHLQGTD